MAATHSTMRNGRGGHVSSTANDYAETMVETYQVRITTTLWKDGRYTVLIVDRETGATINEIRDCYPPNNDYLADLAESDCQEAQRKYELETFS